MTPRSTANDEVNCKTVPVHSIGAFIAEIRTRLPPIFGKGKVANRKL
jgi:hypothetical protein